MIASVWKPGWAARLEEAQHDLLCGLLVGFYRLGGVDLVREQIRACLGAEAPPYDVEESGLVLLPRPDREVELIYDLDQQPLIFPRYSDGAVCAECPPVASAALVFARSKTRWVDWVAAWRAEASGAGFPALLPASGEFCRSKSPSA
jgi:hypothetical protein